MTLKEENAALKELLREFISVPMSIDEATVPRGKTPDDAPNQVVVNMSVSWARILKARSLTSQ